MQQQDLKLANGGGMPVVYSITGRWSCTPCNGLPLHWLRQWPDNKQRHAVYKDKL